MKREPSGARSPGDINSNGRYKVNWKLLESIISAYRLGEISRGRFIREWGTAQGALGIITVALPSEYTERETA